ncbi:MAG TPA: hypothetical protein VK324_15685 [Tepidisphaeraceae bacterium]|nr:hypothetical protein [Tepidisphaeraceae bacterium]
MATRKRASLDPDFREFIASLNSAGVRYLLLGGYAVNYYGHHRFTADINFWVAIDPDNRQRLSAALQQFGFSATSVMPDQFVEPGKVHTFGFKPVRIDLLTGPSGVDFEACYSRRVTDVLDGVEVSIIGLADLRDNKLASGRDKDLLDLKRLPTPHP